MDPIKTETETILLCDDELSVRRFVRTLLTRHGYQVFRSAERERALEDAETHSGTIQLCFQT